MKIYNLSELEPSSDSTFSLLKIISYPEYLDSHLEVCFINAPTRIIPQQEIAGFIKALYLTKTIDIKLANEIIADYAHLFNESDIEANFPSPSRDALFSHLGKAAIPAKEHFKALNKKIAASAHSPELIQIQLERAAHLANFGHYDIAKDDYERLGELVIDDNIVALKILKGINYCESQQEFKVNVRTPYRVIKKDTPLPIQTLFTTIKSSKSAPFISIHRPQRLGIFKQNEKLLKPSAILVERYLISQDLDIVFEKHGSHYKFSVEINNDFKEGMYVGNAFKTKIISLLNDVNKLMSFLLHEGKTATKIAAVINNYLMDTLNPGLYPNT